MSKFRIIPKGALEYASVSQFPSSGSSASVYVALDTYMCYKWIGGRYIEGGYRYEGYPKYNGSYLNVSNIEFTSICSPSPINWEVGDWMYYPRTGLRYEIFSIPQPKKEARVNTYGGAISYSNVLLESLTKYLAICPFRDLVLDDNNIHFSTQPSIAVTCDVRQIAERLQANLDDFAPNKWEFRIYDGLDDATQSLISEAKDFSVSGASCFEVLNKIYDVWENIGWVHTCENGKNIITIGRPNARNSSNTTNPYLYGKGNGLLSIKRTQANKDELATRLYIYGSQRNMLTDYYNKLDIKDKDSVHIANLMLPVSEWGKTDGKPDARLAFLENATAITKFGLRPATVYFDGSGDYGEIYPSIERMTAGLLRSAKESIGSTEYIPTAADNTPIDSVFSVNNPTDDGLLSTSTGEKYESVSITPQSQSQQYEIEDNKVSIPLWSGNLLHSGKAEWKINQGFRAIFPPEASIMPEDVDVRVKVLSDGIDVFTKQVEVTQTPLRDGFIGTISAEFTTESLSSGATSITLEMAFSSDVSSLTFICNSGTLTYQLYKSLTKKFTMRIPQIGFDISKRASLVDSGLATIALKTGKCAGRSFVIDKCQYNSSSDTWSLDVYRGLDESLNMYFPNQDYTIEEGDKFILLDIVMPDEYVFSASQRLLTAGTELLADLSRISPFYEPEIDAKVMMEDGRSLREGMYFHLHDEDIVNGNDEYILIDTLTINEGESNIPTYRITLREKKRKTFQQITNNAISSALTSIAKTSTTTTGGNSTDANALPRKEFDEMFEMDRANNAIRAKYAFYSNYSISAGGISHTGGGGEGGATVLSELNDVKVADISNGQLLVYNNGFWSNVDQSVIKPDMTEYYTKTQVNSALLGKQDVINQSNKLNYNLLSNTPIIPSLTSQLTNDSGYLTQHQDISGKQDVISDLDTIRSGAASGATAYQKPSAGIPEKDLSSSLKTKINIGASSYIKPSDGIPSSDMSSSVQTSLGKADTALQPSALNGYALESWVEGKGYLVASDISGKQDVISDLDTIRSNASIGATHAGTAHAPSNAQKNVQSDWNTTNSGYDSYIKNKPTALPASDVYDWAKAATKPSYTASEVGARPDSWLPTKNDVGLGNVDNTSDVDKPISNATNQALAEKLDVTTFNNLFEYDAVHNAIRAKLGFYSDSFVSACGINEEGGGSGSSLAELDDVNIKNVSNGHLLVYNNGYWSNVSQSTIIPDMSQYYTKTQVDSALSSKQNAISQLNKLPYSYISGVPTNVSQFNNDSGYITSSSLETASVAYATSAGKLQNARTLWGVKFDGTKNISGSMYNVGTINFEEIGGVNLSINNLGLFTSTKATDYWTFGYRFADADGSNLKYIWGAKGNGNELTRYFFGGTSLNPLISLTPDGKLGVGTTSPSEKLSVNGNMVATGEITAYSDRRLKSNIKDLKDRGRLRPVTFVKDGKDCIGFIAQEVEEYYPELVATGGNGIKSLNYGALTAVLARQLYELKEEVELLKKKIDESQ